MHSIAGRRDFKLIPFSFRNYPPIEILSLLNILKPGNYATAAGDGIRLAFGLLIFVLLG